MRFKGFNRTIILKDRVILLQLLQFGPTLAKDILAERSIQQNKVLYSANDLLKLVIAFAGKQLVDNLLQFSYTDSFILYLFRNGKPISLHLLVMWVNEFSNESLGLVIADDVVIIQTKHIKGEVLDKYLPFGKSDVDYLFNPLILQSFSSQSEHIQQGFDLIDS